ncbi:TIGR02611 family protein [Motilibacter aurantiacus]|uniref:TIGR02611 family protein n=1 Tax=Motilibacter aurantiacus TaxID=2714955 RepID=UPI002F2B64B8
MTSAQQGPAGVDQGGATRLERYHAWRDRRIATSRTRRMVWRTIIGALGGLIVVLGLALVPLPGPGWLIVFLGVGVLATEFTWAERLLELGKDLLDKWTDWLGRQPIWVRGLIGLACFVFVCAVVVVTLRIVGAPGWVPDWVPLVR